MAIYFAYDQRADLALFTLTGPFDLEEWLQSAETGRFTPAFFEIVDMRRCDLNAMRAMDLFKFSRYLHQSAREAGRLIPGKTVILVAEEGPLIYTPAHRVFHSFFIFAQENKLPRDYKLFTDVNKALGWFGSRQIIDRHARTLKRNGDQATLSANAT
ncbi:MAG: hypothetical protein HF981_18595 [Desulfobacteraceae bacterium]|nr:hypothetical protein [Desulfobacteraceae bacterium]MBC2752407.1 hypothetical protein [Desulfobacteraceae bacterium]